MVRFHRSCDIFDSGLVFYQHNISIDSNRALICLLDSEITLLKQRSKWLKKPLAAEACDQREGWDERRSAKHARQSASAARFDYLRVFSRCCLTTLCTALLRFIYRDTRIQDLQKATVTCRWVTHWGLIDNSMKKCTIMNQKCLKPHVCPLVKRWFWNLSYLDYREPIVLCDPTVKSTIRLDNCYTFFE